ncbi:molybdopterin-binding protein [Actinokineospora globicatena]|nr:molybdopterin-binding protein [Actinokineospora globicatena]
MAALVGVLAVAAALAAGHVVAGFVGPNASPFLAVGNTAIDLTPSWLKNFAVRTFGTYDKVVLLGGMGLTIVVFAVVAGLLSRRTPLPGLVLASVLGLLGVAAVLNRPDLGALAVVAPLASLVVGVVAFRFLHNSARARGSSDESRRTFLKVSGGVAVGAGVLGGFGQFLSGRVDVEGSRAAVGRLTPKVAAPAIPRGAEFPGNPTFITQNRDFYRVDTALTVPRLRAEDWHLRIHGLVDTELNLDYGDIRGRPLVERTITMTCVSNEVGGPYISTSNFIGIPLRDLLMEAGVQPSADQLFSSSIDGWTAGTPVADLMDQRRGALLAIGMNGEPLPLEHGFPARMVVPGLYGYVSATKWVVDMELTRFGEKPFYWEERGWGTRGPIKTQSRIDVPRGFASVPAGPVTIAGIAWAQTVGIARVEVRIDGGAWQEADLGVEVNDQTWRQWQTTFQLTAGSHRAEVRATDRRGMAQTEMRVPPIPDGATGWHSSLFTVE